jgi:hypothetical protein
MKRLVKKVDLITPTTIYFDEDTKKYSVEMGDCSPAEVDVEGRTLYFKTGEPECEETAQ